MRIELYDTDPATELEVPGKFEVCPRCAGHGVHDCWEGGMTSDEMEQQSPDFLEDYMAGVYSVPCTRCKGVRVIEVIDRSLTAADVLARYDRQARELAYDDELSRAERAYGA